METSAGKSGWIQAAALLFFTFGCVSVKATRVDMSQTYAPVSPEQVVFYVSKDKVPVPHEDVAILTAKGDDDWTREEGMRNAMRKKAAKLSAIGSLWRTCRGRAWG